MKPFIGMFPEVVQEIPSNINGIKYYVIDIPEEVIFTKYKDGGTLTCIPIQEKT